LKLIQCVQSFPITGIICGTQLLHTSTASPAIQLEFPQFSYLGIGGCLEGLGHAREWWGTTTMYFFILKCVEKTKPCYLVTYCNGKRSLFVLLHQSFLPNSTFKGLRTPHKTAFRNRYCSYVLCVTWTNIIKFYKIHGTYIKIIDAQQAECLTAIFM